MLGRFSIIGGARARAAPLGLRLWWQWCIFRRLANRLYFIFKVIKKCIWRCVKGCFEVGWVVWRDFQTVRLFPLAPSMLSGEFFLNNLHCYLNWVHQQYSSLQKVNTKMTFKSTSSILWNGTNAIKPKAIWLLSHRPNYQKIHSSCYSNKFSRVESMSHRGLIDP